MSLKLTVDSLDEIPEGVRDLYQETESGKFALQVEGAVPKQRLDEFRETNRTLKSQLDQVQEQMKKFEGVDLETYQKLLEEQDKARGKKLLEEGDVEKLVNERVTKVVSKKDQELQEREQRINGLESQLSTLLIDNELKDVAIRAGVLETAVPDVIMRGRQQFRLMDGKAVAVDQQGNKIYGDDGVSPLTMNEWITSLKSNATHLFKPSSGGDAPGSFRRPPSGNRDNSEMSSTDKIAAGLANRNRR